MRILLVIGVFDPVLGPRCLHASPGDYCPFSDTGCSGEPHPIFLDAFNTKEDHVFFEEGEYTYEVLKFEFRAKEVPRGVARFVIILKVPQFMGQVTPEILAEMRKGFTSLVLQKNYEISPIIAQSFKNKWERELWKRINVTTTQAFTHALRDQLNTAAGFLQLAMRDLRNQKAPVDGGIIGRLEKVLNILLEIGELKPL